MAPHYEVVQGSDADAIEFPYSKAGIGDACTSYHALRRDGLDPEVHLVRNATEWKASRVVVLGGLGHPA